MFLDVAQDVDRKIKFHTTFVRCLSIVQTFVWFNSGQIAFFFLSSMHVKLPAAASIDRRSVASHRERHSVDRGGARTTDWTWYIPIRRSDLSRRMKR